MHKESSTNPVKVDIETQLLNKYSENLHTKVEERNILPPESEVIEPFSPVGNEDSNSKLWCSIYKIPSEGYMYLSAHMDRGEVVSVSEPTMLPSLDIMNGIDTIELSNQFDTQSFLVSACTNYPRIRLYFLLSLKGDGNTEVTQLGFLSKNTFFVKTQSTMVKHLLSQNKDKFFPSNANIKHFDRESKRWIDFPLPTEES